MLAITKRYNSIPSKNNPMLSIKTTPIAVRFNISAARRVRVKVRVRVSPTF
jgi:hypothetical protein